MMREQRSRQEVEKARNASLSDRGIDDTLAQEIQGLNVRCGAHKVEIHAKAQMR